MGKPFKQLPEDKWPKDIRKRVNELSAWNSRIIEVKFEDRSNAVVYDTDDKLTIVLPKSLAATKTVRLSVVTNGSQGYVDVPTSSGYVAFPP